MICRRLAIAGLAWLGACNTRSVERHSASTDSLDQAHGPTDAPVAADSVASGGTSLKPGLYLGSWRVPGDRRTHWFVVFFGIDSFRGVVYNPPRADELCVARVDSAGSVRLETGSLGGSMPYRLAIDGRLTMRGIRGRVTVSGAQYDEATSPIEMERVALGTAVGDSASNTSGLYASVNLHSETGDLLGDELFLVKGERRIVAIYTSYEGEADGPYVADSVTLAGEQVWIAGYFGTASRSQYNFTLNEQVKRIKTLSDFLSPESVLRCGPPTPSRSKDN